MSSPIWIPPGGASPLVLLDPVQLLRVKEGSHLRYGLLHLGLPLLPLLLGLLEGVLLSPLEGVLLPFAVVDDEDLGDGPVREDVGLPPQART